MLYLRLKFMLATVVVVAFASNRSQAQFPYPYGWQGLGMLPPAGNFYGFNINVPTPPYFALHPPVFYSYRVARPYGISPYAAWPTTENDLWKARSPRKPVAILNPHVPSVPAESIPTPEEMTSSEPPRPLTVYNPFVVNERNVANQPITDHIDR